MPPGISSVEIGVPSGITLPSCFFSTTFGWALSWASSSFVSSAWVASSSAVQARRPRHLGNFEQPSHGPRRPERRLSFAPHFGHSTSTSSAGGVGYLIASFLSRLIVSLTFG
jgi:hypothetical protein